MIYHFLIDSTKYEPRGHSIVKNTGGGAGLIVGVWDFGWEKIFWGSSKILIFTTVRV